MTNTNNAKHQLLFLISIAAANFFSCSKTSFSGGGTAPRVNKGATNVNAASGGDPQSSDDPDSPDASPNPNPSQNPDATPTPSPSPSNIVTTTTSTTTVTECTPDKFLTLGTTPVPPEVTDINSPSGLAAITEGRRYRLTADINLTGIWTPLISGRRVYIDGNGHSITGLNINVPDGSGTSGHHSKVGLFEYLNGSSIINLKIISPTVVARFGVGVIAGAMDRSCIENIEITNANLSATYEAGVIAGKVDYGAVSIRNVNASVTILQGPDAQNVRWTIGAAGDIGGLFGRLQNGGAGTNYISDTILQFDITADTPPGTSGIGSLIGGNQVPVQISNTTATGTMRCISPTCFRGGRYVGNFGVNFPDPILQNTTVNLTKTGTWDNFKDN